MCTTHHAHGLYDSTVRCIQVCFSAGGDYESVSKLGIIMFPAAPPLLPAPPVLHLSACHPYLLHLFLLSFFQGITQHFKGHFFFHSNLAVLWLSVFSEVLNSQSCQRGRSNPSSSSPYHSYVYDLNHPASSLEGKQRSLS